MLILYLWSLLIAPYNLPVCTIWAAKWDAPAIVQACGKQVADNLSAYSASLRHIRTGQVVEIASAASLPGLTGYQRDMYMVTVIQAEISPIICTIEGEPSATPARSDIAAQCPQGLKEFDKGNTVWRGPFSVEQHAPPAPTCQLAPVAQPDLANMATYEFYGLLQSQLRWFALSDHVTWQNQWDEEILLAGIYTNVPADLLKAVMGAESQMWPLAVGINHEYGMIQLTDDGAGLALLYSKSLWQKYCPQALHGWWCANRSYATLPAAYRALVRQALLADLACPHCDPQKGADLARADILTYARILAAYRCYSLALMPGAGWDVTLAVYHAGAECIVGGTICEQGQYYLRRMNEN